MPRVLILTASYGSGHNAAARALTAAFAHDGVDVVVVDHFRDLVHPLFERASRALYLAVLRRAPPLWGAAYGLADWMSADSPLALGLTRVGTSALARRLARDAPDAVVTVHATPAAALSALAASGRRVPLHTTVVTDFVAHSQWIARHADRYCVAADPVRRDFIARGIPGHRVVVTGIPVDPAFETLPDPGAARAALGLPIRSPFVLAMAGSHGSLGRLGDVARTLCATRRPLCGLLVAGHDAPLERTLRRCTAGTSLRAVGHVADVRTLMAAADLLITKAGGMTLAEAMAAELPLLLFGSIPGQERQNERFAARAGIALVARSRRELAARLERALAEPALLESLRAGLRRLRHGDAARRIAELVLTPAPVP